MNTLELIRERELSAERYCIEYLDCGGSTHRVKITRCQAISEIREYGAPCSFNMSPSEIQSILDEMYK